MKVSPGNIVCSLAGKDSGSYFVVMSVVENYAFICDGRNRKTDKPKKKKVKHLNTECGYSHYIALKLEKGEQVTNAELRNELKPYVKP
ncbi:MAG: RNA-binding protein [Clostridia bacterium]|nr:RNA-binding protein [Clostridia bacterium]MEE1043219.1 RNA-binding protein [Clostridia bacterium]